MRTMKFAALYDHGLSAACLLPCMNDGSIQDPEVTKGAIS
ncbi:MAG: hypothetical protein OJF50_006577 [Nitrospira sp.]|nr:hypothetical protein [Nitrospira sp.]